MLVLILFLIVMVVRIVVIINIKIRNEISVELPLCHFGTERSGVKNLSYGVPLWCIQILRFLNENFVLPCISFLKMIQVTFET